MTAPEAGACASCGQPIGPDAQYCPRCGRPTRNPSPPRGDEEVVAVAVRQGDVLDGKWRLEQKIGEGGMGTVYLARDMALDRPVAVKLLSQALVGDAEVTARFEREARSTAALEHPNIVPVYAVGRHENRPFMVMKKLEGVPLTQMLEQRGALPIDETIALLRQLASGLDFIHSRGFVHRDIKAANIFVSPEGHATILDFGILRASRSTEALTRTGVVMGTPQYMSPEQALGAREIDHRADLYAVAVLLFECLSGTLPFEADSELKLIQMQAHQPPPDIVERAPWIPRAVADVVTRALAKRPEDRFLSATELVQAVEVAAQGGTATPGVAAVRSTGSEVGAHTAPGWRALAKAAPSVGTPGPPAEPRPLAGPPPPTGARSGFDSMASPVAVGPSSTGARSGFDLVASPAAVAPVGQTTDELPAEVPRSRRWGLLALAGMLLALVGAGLWARPFSSWRAPTELPAIDAGPELRVAAAVPDAATALGLDLSDADAGEELTDAGEELADAPTDAGSGAKPVGKHRVVKRPKEPATPGRLNVLTLHKGEPTWADVLVDGVSRGRTPLLLELPNGTYRVRVARTGFQPEERQVKVASGRVAVVRFVLTE